MISAPNLSAVTMPSGVTFGPFTPPKRRTHTNVINVARSVVNKKAKRYEQAMKAQDYCYIKDYYVTKAYFKKTFNQGLWLSCQSFCFQNQV